MTAETAILALQVINLAVLAGVFYRQGDHGARIRGLEARTKNLEGKVHGQSA